MENIEIREDLEGNIFAIKNIRQEFNGNEVTFKADIGGNLEAGQRYLESLAKSIKNNILEQFKL